METLVPYMLLGETVWHLGLDREIDPNRNVVDLEPTVRAYFVIFYYNKRFYHRGSIPIYSHLTSSSIKIQTHDFQGKIVNSAKMEINVPENRKVRERQVLQLSEVQSKQTWY